MTDKHRHMIGQIDHNEPTEQHPDYSLTVIVGVYMLMLVPLVLLAYGLELRNNWSTDVTILFFAVALMIFTLVYISIAMGILVRLVRAFLGYFYKRYVASLQYRAYVTTLKHEYPQVKIQEYGRVSVMERPLLPDSNNNRQLMMDFVRTLYETNDDGSYINIHADGRIIGAVPWSTRQRKINEQIALNWIDKTSYKGKPFIYFKDKGWYLNVQDYPDAHRVLNMFEKTYVPEAQIEDGEFRDAAAD